MKKKRFLKYTFHSNTHLLISFLSIAQNVCKFLFNLGDCSCSTEISLWFVCSEIKIFTERSLRVDELFSYLLVIVHVSHFQRRGICSHVAVKRTISLNVITLGLHEWEMYHSIYYKLFNNIGALYLLFLAMYVLVPPVIKF